MTKLFRTILLVCVCLTFGRKATAQKGVVKELKKHYIQFPSVYLYPSTMRVINIQNNPEVNELISQIDHIQLFRLRPSKVSVEQLDSVATLLTEGGFDLGAELFTSGKMVSVYVKPARDQIVLVTTHDHKVVIGEMVGSVNIMKLPEVYKTLAQDSLIQHLGFQDLLGIGKGTYEEIEEDIETVESDKS